MADIVLNPLANMQTPTLLNQNMQKVADSLNSDVVHTSGGKNVMNQDLDLNGNELLNVATDPTNPNSLAKIEDLGTYGVNAKASADLASSKAVEAANSAAQAAGSASSAAASVASAEVSRGYATKALMDADLSPADGTIRLVTNDATTANNQSYRKSGAPGTGSWVASVDRLANALGNGAGFQQSGGVLRTIAAKLSESVSFFDFIDPSLHAGIRSGSDQNDYSTQMQAAMDFAASNRVPCVANGGFFHISKPLIVRKEMMLIGMGRGKTNIILLPAANCEALVFDQTIAGNMTATIASISFNGNKANQTDSTKVLVDLKDPVATSSRIYVHDIFIQNAKGGGFRAQDVNRDSVFDGITTYQCDGIGVDCSTADSCWNNINAGSSGLQGIVLRRSGTYGTMKSWSSGMVTSGLGYGFHVLGPAVIAPALWAQDNAQHGLFLDGSASSNPTEACSIRIVSENSGGMGVLISSSNYNRVDILCRDRIGGSYTHSRCIRLVSSVKNVIDCTNRTNAVFIDTGYVTTGNTVRSGTRGVTDKSYVGGYTISPSDAEVFRTTLTGNVTVNAPNNFWEGCEVEFQFKQDATGGWTTTFDPVFKVNWTPVTTAGKTNTIRFRYDGTNWVQMSAATGL